MTNKAKTYFFEKTIKIEKSLARWKKKKMKEKLQMNKIQKVNRIV